MPVLAACVVLLVAGVLLKAQCFAGWGGREYSRLCYNDIQALYGVRHLDVDTFPYVDGEIADGDLTGGAIEYPVLTGLFMWATALPVDDVNSYLRISFIALAPFALLVAYLLDKMSGRRALLWSLAPALALYAFHNWDVLAVAATVAGFYQWWRGRPLWAAVAFAVGAALKLYPLAFMLPLALEVASKGRAPDAPAGSRWDVIAGARVAAVGAATWIAINLPFASINFEGWFATYEFHSERGSNYDSIWTAGWPTLGPDRLNLASTGLTLVAIAVVVVLSLWKTGKDGHYPFLQTCAALLAAAMLFGKVHSPQYALWILPFFALLRVNIAWWVAYTIADLAVYVGVFRFFYDNVYQGLSESKYQTLMNYGVWARAGLLLALTFVFLWSRPSEPLDAEKVALSHPSPNLGTVGDRLTAPG